MEKKNQIEKPESVLLVVKSFWKERSEVVELKLLVDFNKNVIFSFIMCALTCLTEDSECGTWECAWHNKFCRKCVA